MFRQIKHIDVGDDMKHLHS